KLCLELPLLKKLSMKTASLKEISWCLGMITCNRLNELLVSINSFGLTGNDTMYPPDFSLDTFTYLRSVKILCLEAPAYSIPAFFSVISPESLTDLQLFINCFQTL